MAQKQMGKKLLIKLILNIKALTIKNKSNQNKTPFPKAGVALCRQPSGEPSPLRGHGMILFKRKQAETRTHDITVRARRNGCD